MAAGSHSLRRLCGLKYQTLDILCLHQKSQPAKAVWIEISRLLAMPYPPLVTACEGCVD